MENEYSSEAAANEIAAKLQSEDANGWNYLVRVDPKSGRAVIEVYDETGYLLGKL